MGRSDNFVAGLKEYRDLDRGWMAYVGRYDDGKWWIFARMPSGDFVRLTTRPYETEEAAVLAVRAYDLPLLTEELAREVQEGKYKYQDGEFIKVAP